MAFKLLMNIERLIFFCHCYVLFLRWKVVPTLLSLPQSMRVYLQFTCNFHLPSIDAVFFMILSCLLLAWRGEKLWVTRYRWVITINDDCPAKDTWVCFFVTRKTLNVTESTQLAASCALKRHNDSHLCQRLKIPALHWYFKSKAVCMNYKAQDEVFVMCWREIESSFLRFIFFLCFVLV